MSTHPWSHQCSPHVHLGTHTHTEPIGAPSQKPQEGIGAGSLAVRHSQRFCKTPPLPLGVLTTVGPTPSRKLQHVAAALKGGQESGSGGEKEGRGAGWKEGTLHRGWPRGWPRRAKGPQTGANACPGCLDVREGPIDTSPTLFKLRDHPAPRLRL